MSYRSVKSILATGLDHLPLDETAEPPLHLPAMHAHVRGAAYYAHHQTCETLDDTSGLAVLTGEPACSESPC